MMMMMMMMMMMIFFPRTREKTSCCASALAQLGQCDLEAPEVIVVGAPHDLDHLCPCLYSLAQCADLLLLFVRTVPQLGDLGLVLLALLSQHGGLCYFRHA